MKAAGTILVVDDDPLVRAILSNRLQSFGYEVASAEDGGAAIRMAVESPPDCVLLDIEMPEKDGFQVARELRRLEATQGVPIIMLTARGETESKLKGFELIVNDYVTKPFVFEELHARIQVQIKLKKAEQVLLERQKQAALMDLVDGLADTLLNRLNLSLVHIQLVGDQMRGRVPDEGMEGLKTLRESIWKSVEVVNELMRHTNRLDREAVRPLELSPLLEALPQEFPDLGFRMRIGDLPPVKGSGGVKEAFSALCKNALEAMRDCTDAPLLEVDAAPEGDGRSVRVSFRDWGCGIQRRDLPKLFTPFFTTKGTRSHGLGLWTVYRTMEDLGGRVDVVSEPEKGAEFVLVFPVVRGAPKLELVGARLSSSAV